MIRVHRRPRIDPSESSGFFRNCSALVEFKRLGGKHLRRWTESPAAADGKTRFLSLNDVPENTSLPPVRSTANSAPSGGRNCGSFWPRPWQPLDNAAIVLAAHPNLALPAAFMKGLSHQLKTCRHLATA